MGISKQNSQTYHDVRCAEALCDRAYLIADGVVQRSGGKELVREYFAP